MIRIIKVNAPVYSRNVGYEISAVRIVGVEELTKAKDETLFQTLLDELQDKYGTIDCGGEDKATHHVDDYDMLDLEGSSVKKIAATLNAVVDRIAAFYKGES